MKRIINLILILVGIVFLLFIIDLICVFTIERPLLAIRDYSVHSYDKAYKGLFFNVRKCYVFDEVEIDMKNTYHICPSATEEQESLYNIVQLENVRMWLENTSVKGTTLVIQDTNENPYTYGEWYAIEKQINGKWYELKKDNEDYKFNSYEYLIDENNNVRFEMNWDKIYGELW
jgi:hypothetical protein